MSYLLIVLALLATVVGIRGDTWNHQRQGLRKVSITGWVAFALACSIAAFSIVKEYQENSEKQENERKLLFKRLDGLDSLATQSWYLSSMFKSIAKDIDDRPELYELSLNQLRFMKDELSRSQSSYAQVLDRSERIALEHLMLQVTGSLHGLTLEKQVTNSSDFEYLATEALEANITFCQSIKEKNPLCYMGETVGAN
ncbi:hypothetical protein [Marinobacterium stanieri]|uniref:Uncharacterized protein n=1 Tax=Marinobacterium stanieri TaxID=49186 RepID=A0A1N6XZZ1_9GAMM|nr:hypothetical protein [Marinobacterium stanieri]SIR07888.1 hypothetical protein SAMN05421647_1203 [Marinobacterium stanieri]